MENKYTSFLKKSVVDLLQYSNHGIEDAISLTFETILKAEQSEFLGYNWGNKSDLSTTNKRNGYRTSLVQGLNKVFRVKVPRDRLGLFKPVFLDLLAQEKEELHSLAFKLYSKGLTTRDINDIFSEIYNYELSKSAISRISTEFTEERRSWQDRSLHENYYAIFIDAIWLPIRRNTVQHEAFYIALGLKDDLTRDVLSVWTFPEENASGWEEMLIDLKKRGVKNVLNFTADGLPGLKEAIGRTFPKSSFQRCIIHKKRNILNRVRASDKREISLDFDKIFSLDDEATSLEQTKSNLNEFLSKWVSKYPSLKRQFPNNEIDNYFSFLKYPAKFRRIIYTTNWIESLNKRIKRTTKIRDSFPNEDSALNLVCAMLIDKCERNLKKYKVSSLVPIKDNLDEKLENIKDKNNIVF